MDTFIICNRLVFVVFFCLLGKMSFVIVYILFFWKNKGIMLLVSRDSVIEIYKYKDIIK